ncbi:MAG: T9SS type A sorting domain-containing protein [Bacteroidetes bacterium]|nr:T9SS type A sorting domain-containing protein [Bacteroidota bacterium]
METTGRITHENQATIKVYPNPSDGTIYQEIPGGSRDPVHIFSGTGKQVYQGPFSSQLELSHLSPGIYNLSCGRLNTRIAIY